MGPEATFPDVPSLQQFCCTSRAFSWQARFCTENMPRRTCCWVAIGWLRADSPPERKFWSFPASMENFPCGPQTRTSDNVVSAVLAHSSHTKPTNIALLLKEVSGTKRMRNLKRSFRKVSEAHPEVRSEIPTAFLAGRKVPNPKFPTCFPSEMSITKNFTTSFWRHSNRET